MPQSSYNVSNEQLWEWLPGTSFPEGEQENAQSDCKNSDTGSQTHTAPNTALKKIFVFPRVNFTVSEAEDLVASWELLLEL